MFIPFVYITGSLLLLRPSCIYTLTSVYHIPTVSHLFSSVLRRHPKSSRVDVRACLRKLPKYHHLFTHSQLLNQARYRPSHCLPIKSTPLQHRRTREWRHFLRIRQPRPPAKRINETSPLRHIPPPFLFTSNRRTLAPTVIRPYHPRTRNRRYRQRRGATDTGGWQLRRMGRMGRDTL